MEMTAEFSNFQPKPIDCKPINSIHNQDVILELPGYVMSKVCSMGFPEGRDGVMGSKTSRKSMAVPSDERLPVLLNENPLHTHRCHLTKNSFFVRHKEGIACLMFRWNREISARRHVKRLKAALGKHIHEQLNHVVHMCECPSCSRNIFLPIQRRSFRLYHLIINEIDEFFICVETGWGIV